MKRTGSGLKLALALCAALGSFSIRAQEPKAAPPEHVKQLVALADQLKQALERGDIDAAGRLNSSINAGIVRARQMIQPTPQEQLAKLEQANLNGRARANELPRLALTALEAGEYGRAEQYARELMSGSPNSGPAVYYGNLVLGRLALQRDNDMAAAKRLLLASAATAGSPTLNSFGPNMTLARDLLLRGEREAVVQFLELCRKFWKTSNALKKLDEWTALVKGGVVPDFGANLQYCY